jgi:O-antigen/teichoic acid export membrane protein
VEATGATARSSSVEAAASVQSLLLALSRVLKAGFALVVPVFLARSLDQTSFGHYREIALVSLSAVMVLSIGLPASLYHLVPAAPRDARALFAQSALLMGVAGLLGGAAVGLALGEVPGLFQGGLAPYAPWLCVLIALGTPAQLADVVPVVDGRARLAVGLVAAVDGARGLLLIGLAALTRRLDVLLAVLCAVAIARLVFLAVYLARRPREASPGPGRAALARQIAYALPLYSGLLLSIARDQLPSFFVALRANASDFAVYAIGTLEVPVLAHLAVSVAEVLVLRNSGAFASGDPHDFAAVWHRAMQGLASVVLPVFVLLELYAGDLVRLLFGESYSAAVPVLRISLLTVPLSILMTSSVLRSLAELRVIVLGEVASLLTTCTVLLAFAPRSLFLAAISSLVAGRIAFHTVAGWRIADRLGLGLGALLPWRPFTLIAAATAAAGLLGLLLASPLPSWARPFVGGGVSLLCYAPLAWRSGLVPEAERRLVCRWLGLLLCGAGDPQRLAARGLPTERVADQGGLAP